MSACQLVALSAVPAQPWRNGGGIAFDLLAWPPGRSGTGDGWQLRVSVALIDHDGPFSRYPDVSRTFNVLSGGGVRLQLPGRSVTLRAGDAPLHFDGADAPACALLDGPTRHLNLMVVHGAGRARMAVARPGSRLGGTLRWRGLYAHGPVTLVLDGAALPLPAGTLAWADDPDAAAWQLGEAGAGPAWWLSLEPV